MIRQGEIWLVPVPFPDQSGIKLRPALVISSDAQLSKDQDALVMGITTRTGPLLSSLQLDNSDIASGNLHRPAN